jgi:hypothetical protein
MRRDREELIQSFTKNLSALRSEISIKQEGIINTLQDVREYIKPMFAGRN